MNATKFCEYVENRLGWIPPKPPTGRTHFYGTYTMEASRVKKKMATNPKLYTWPHLFLAVELLHRRRAGVQTPIGVFLYVEEALNLARERDDDGLEGQIRSVLTFEQSRGDPDGWTVRFARTAGPYREKALRDWRVNRKERVAREERTPRRV